MPHRLASTRLIIGLGTSHTFYSQIDRRLSEVFYAAFITSAPPVNRSILWLLVPSWIKMAIGGDRSGPPCGVSRV